MSRSKYVSVGNTGGLILDSKYDDFATNAGLQSVKNEIVSAIEAGNLVQAKSPGLVTSVLKYPEPARPKYTISRVSGVQIFAKDPVSGREYAMAYGAIMYNDNEGEGYWGTLWSTPDDFKNVISARRLSNGRLLVVSRATDPGSSVSGIWVSDLAENDTDKTFTKTLEFVEGWPFNHWGWDTVHEDVILCSLYNTTNTRHAYMSRDEGLTWTQIFEGPISHSPVFHIHSIAYDPYHSTIWLVSGDGIHKNIYYTYDWGNVWHTVWPEGSGQGYPQFTSISVMPHCVLLGSDISPDGIYRINKKWRKGGYPLYTIDDLEFAYAVHIEGYPGISQIFHSPVVVNGVHYHATWTSTNDRQYSHIVATNDGVHFYDVYKSKPFTKAQMGIQHITTDGKALIGSYREDGEYQGYQRFYMPLPEWKTL